MKILVKLPAIIYQTYIVRGQDIPYFRTIVTVVSILILHAVHMVLLFEIPPKYIMPWSSGESKSVKWLYGSIYFVIIYTAISMIFKKSKLEKIKVSPQQIKRCKIVLPIYLVTSFLLLVALLIKLGIEKGTI